MGEREMNTAEKKLAWIKDRISEGRTVFLCTCLRATKIQAKHLPLVKVSGNSLMVCHGKRWLDYSFAELKAQ
jgi:altronate dehydratase